LRIGFRDLKSQILEYVKGMRRTHMDSQDLQPYGERKREYFERVMRSLLSVEESKYI